MNIEKIRKEKSMKELLRFSIINIDKPSGPTSFQVSNYVKDSLKVNKTSHFGTLDPMVSGILPVALGRACRLNDYFMHRDKEYVGIMHLHEDVSDSLLKEKIKEMTGKITQLPPVKSKVRRAERIREIKQFKIIEREGKEVLFLALVQAGTYIRKLIHDLGEKIGGAHMAELRRTKAGIFEEPAYNLYELDKAVSEYKKGNEDPLRKMLIPAEIISELLPVVQVKKENLKRILTGKPIFKSDIEGKLPDSKHIAVFHGEKFIQVARIVSEGDIIARPEFVFN